MCEKLPNQFQWDTLEYSLVRILAGMTEIIKMDKRFDLENPYIIVCGPVLDIAFNVSALHADEILKKVNDHLQPDSEFNESFQKFPNQEHNTQTQLYSRLKLPGWNNREAVIHKASLVGGSFLWEADANYRVKPELLAVIRSVTNADQEKEIFKANEITKAVSAYIIQNKSTFFDLRHIRVAHIENSLLEKAFGVKYIDKVQVIRCIKYNVVEKVEKVHPDPEMEVAFSNINTSLEHILPTPEKEIEATEGNAPIEITIPEGGPQTPSENLSCEENIPRQISDSDDSDIHMNSVYNVEYEVDYDDSSSDGKIYTSDNSIIEDIVVTKVYNFNSSESEALADLEDIFEEIKNEKPTLEPSTWKCQKCTYKLARGFRFCTFCWKLRQQELPPRPKPKKRKKVSSENSTQDTSKKIQKKRDLQKSDVNEELVLPVENTQGVNTCPFCLTKMKDSCFIHGQTAHFVSCYSCAKQQTRKSSNCPCCRRKIEKIVKVFGL